MESGRQERFKPDGVLNSQQEMGATGYHGEVTRLRVGETSPHTISSLEKMTEIEKAKNGIFSEASPDFDVTGDDKFDDTQALMAADAAKENRVALDLKGVIYFTDRKKEDFSKEAVAKMEEIVDENKDDPATIVSDINVLRKEAMRGMFNREYPEDRAA